MNWICVAFILSSYIAISTQYNVRSRLERRKRDAVGSLDIVTNNAQPIHADVKNENGFSETPCANSIVNIPPANIEPGVTFKVLPPRDTYHSLRKSFPLAGSLELVRAASRLITIIVLVASAAIEFYPIVHYMYETVHELVSYNFNKV